MKPYLHKALVGLFFLALVMPACAPQPVVTPFVANTPTPTPVFTPTPVIRTLNICLGEEPNTLYPYGNLNAAARSVLSAIYDGPMDIVEYGYEPIILEKIPTLEDGDAQISPIGVTAGTEVVDTTGNVVLLSTGTRVRPSGCRSDDCAIAYDGSSTIQMDQIVVTFTMLAGLMWSDGTPLTSSDSIYSYTLASADVTPGSKFLVDRTQIYEAADEQTIQWWGKPGFIDPDYYTNFWLPLPEHAWSEFPPEDLLRVDVSAKMPLGWGPYILDEWEAGKRLHLIKNLNYFRAESNLPRFDELNFIIIPDADAALSALVEGTCDVLDPSTRLDGHVGLLQQMRVDNQADLLTAQTMVIEWLGMGITPASYDENFDVEEDRPDFFGDKRMRQAIALCLDRQKVVDTVLFGLSQVPDTYLPSDHPLHNGNVQTYEYNPDSGSDILRSEEHSSELQSRRDLVCRLLL